MGDLEAELSAVKAARAKRAAELDAAAKDRRLAAEISRQKTAMAMDEMYAKLEEEHGRGYIKRINNPDGTMVVVRAPESIIARRFADEMARSDHPNPKVRMSLHDAAERMARQCRLYPTLEEFDELTKRFSGLVAVAANEAYDLARPEVDESEGK